MPSSPENVPNILENVERISVLLVALDKKFDQFRQKVESDLQLLRNTVDTLNDSVSNLSVCLQENKEQTTAKLAHLQTSLNSTQSSPDKQTGKLNNKLDGLSSKLNTLNITLPTPAPYSHRASPPPDLPQFHPVLSAD